MLPRVITDYEVVLGHRAVAVKTVTDRERLPGDLLRGGELQAAGGSPGV